MCGERQIAATTPVVALGKVPDPPSQTLVETGAGLESPPDPPATFEAEPPITDSPPAEILCAGCAKQLDEDERFCTQCGLARDGAPFAKDEHDGGLRAPSVSSNARLLIGIVAVLALVGAAYFLYWRQPGKTEKVAAAIGSDAGAAAGSDAAVSAASLDDGMATPIEVPPAETVAGKYLASVGDQEISLTLNPAGSQPLRSTSGVAHYFNKVARRDCSAMISPIAHDASVEGQAFDQGPVAGMTACERNIRVRMRAEGSDGSRLAAVWTDPVTGAELMRADLRRDD